MEFCIESIRKAQLPDGGFLHQSSPSQDFSADVISYKSTFFTANILNCLNAVPGTDDIRAAAAGFLLSQRSVHWSFNYWARDEAVRMTKPYPDDLDDTFVALTALHGYDPSLIDGTALAHVAKLLTATEVAPGGPYRTWLVAADALSRAAADEWRDVDLVVNANIGSFLVRLGIILPNLDRFVRDRAADRESLCSPYYPGPMQVEYFVARYLGNLPEWFAGWLGGRRAGNIYDHPYPFCIDPSRDGKTCYASAAALDAALYAEALATLAENNKQQSFISSETSLDRIKATARVHSGRLAEPLRGIVMREIDATQTEEIVTVPFAMHVALGKPAAVSSRLLDDLALANLYGWMAYTIYDDVLDGDKDEQATRLRLSAANFFLRELTAYYVRLESDIPGIGEYFSLLLDGIDSANAEEQLLRAGEIPIERLAERSLGHALPAIAVLLVAGVTKNMAYETGEAVQLTISFFRNYLIARQLHDDAHDWSDDLAHGRLNSAGARLMAMQPTGASNDLGGLRKFFWREAIPVIVDDIKKYLNKARADLAALSKMGAIIQPAAFEEWLSRLEAAAERATIERDEVDKFVTAFT